MKKRTEETILKVTLGFLVVMLLGISTFLVTAVAMGKNSVDIVSSIRVADNGEVPEAQEAAQLAHLAKVTADDAKAIALSVVDTSVVGEVTDVQLENEDGNVVYAVEFDKNGMETDVKIDAGNGNVLLVEDENIETFMEDSNQEELEDNDKEESDDFEQDGIDHEFEGDEGDHED